MGEADSKTAADAVVNGQTMMADADSSNGADAPIRNIKELVELKKQVRDIHKMLGSLSDKKGEVAPLGNPAPAGDPLAEIGKLRAEISFRDAISEMNVPSQQRKILQRLYQAERPEHIGEWLTEAVSSLSLPKPSAELVKTDPVAALPHVQPVLGRNTGAPAADEKSLLPDDPKLIPIGIWKGMSRDERMARWKAHVKSSGAESTAFGRSK